jgi:hypothetical protein
MIRDYYGASSAGWNAVLLERSKNKKNSPNDKN